MKSGYIQLNKAPVYHRAEFLQNSKPTFYLRNCNKPSSRSNSTEVRDVGPGFMTQDKVIDKTMALLAEIMKLNIKKTQIEQSIQKAEKECKDLAKHLDPEIARKMQIYKTISMNDNTVQTSRVYVLMKDAQTSTEDATKEIQPKQSKQFQKNNLNNNANFGDQNLMDGSPLMPQISPVFVESDFESASSDLRSLENVYARKASFNDSYSNITKNRYPKVSPEKNIKIEYPKNKNVENRTGFLQPKDLPFKNQNVKNTLNTGDRIKEKFEYYKNANKLSTIPDEGTVYDSDSLCVNGRELGGNTNEHQE